MTSSFQSPRLTYRALTPSDHPFISTLLSDPTSCANSHTDLLKPPTAAFAQSFLTTLMHGTLLSVLICLPSKHQSDNISPTEDPTPIGQIHLNATRGEEHHRKASIGIDIIAAYQGQGYGSEALQWVLKWGFQIAGLHRIELFCFEWNPGAKKLYERLGFRLEGQRREALWYEGRWWDQFEYGMLEGEWRVRYLEPL